jgi:hypothetical protein
LKCSNKNNATTSLSRVAAERLTCTSKLRKLQSEEIYIRTMTPATISTNYDTHKKTSIINLLAHLRKTTGIIKEYLTKTETKRENIENY